MLIANLDGVKIQSITCAVPYKVDNFDEYRLRFGDEAVDKFSSMTSVKSRRIASKKQTSSDLAFAAARHLLELEQINKDEIGACIFVTQTPDYRLPSSACVIAKRLGLPVDCLAFDVNLGCSGYVYGLNIAISLMKTNSISNMLLLVGDTSTKVISPEDRSACMLFGDSGSATLLVKDIDSGMSGSYRTDGNRFKAIIIPAGAYRNLDASTEHTIWCDGNVRSDYDLYMNGTDVFTFTISEVPKLIEEFLRAKEKTIDDYNAFVLHQANYYILKQVAKKLKIPIEKMPVSMDRFGNTSVTSIPLTLCDAYAGRTGIVRVLMCGFGVGLSWGVVDTIIESARVHPIFETDEYYDEGGVRHD